MGAARLSRGFRHIVAKHKTAGDRSRRTIGAGADPHQLRRALEKGGVEFIAENGGGAGVRMRKRGNK